MEIEGARRIAAPRAEVWAALNDPLVLQAAIPGCSAIVPAPEGGLHATVTQKVGPLEATFRGRLHLTDVEPMQRYTLAAEGIGGKAGRAKGSAAVELSDAEGGGTLLTYVVRADVGGRLAQFGGRFIDGFAQRLADSFFQRLEAALGAAPAAGSDAAPAASGWLARMIGRL